MFDYLDKLIDPVPKSNIRERALERTLARRREQLDYAVKAREVRGLSPVERLLNQQHAELIKGDLNRLSEARKALRAAKAAEDQADVEFRRLSPARERQGLFRSDQSRMAAILGYLDRERRQVAPLSREAEARAKAIAASRGLYDVKSAYRRNAPIPGVSGTFGPEHLRGVDVAAADVDPCTEYKMRRVVQREVMFALRKASRGYPGRRDVRSPC